MIGAPLTAQSRGFTLVELMVIVSIIGILAAIAIPSYRRYAVTNAERETQAKMLQLELQLERWRASALTYRNFEPLKADGRTRGYDSGDTIIYVPTGSNAANHRYQITLVDGTDTAKSLKVNGGSSTVDTITGRSWKMLAIPNLNGSAATGHNIMLTSEGVRCQNTAAVRITEPSCGAGEESW